ncbi:MAG: Holliday junction resolvase RuvX [Phototrophicales bacterium]|nr:MAG: Holliday junction resolvase RuvX [Phototrophicales bacterium]RMG75187.1 MAG: Holliday junction resolvase RuvX [Chloroflexota bacterium]
MSSGKLLGIDHGLQRIGLAVCDETRLIARELTIIYRKSKQEDFEQINQLAMQERVVGIIVGIPSDSDAPPGVYTQADKVRRWVMHLREATHLPIMLWDETLSSQDAADLARQKKRKPTDPIDDLAARLILQSYLDAVRDGLAEAL